MSLSPSATKPDTSVSSEASSIRRSFSTPSYRGPVFEDDDVVIGMSLVSLAENEKKKKKKGWKNGWSRGSASESDLRSPTKEFFSGGRTGSAEEAVVVVGGGGGKKEKGKGKKVLGWTTKWKRRNSDPTVIIPERNSIEEGTSTSSSSPSSSTSTPLEFNLPSPDILPVETPTTERIFLGVPPRSTTHRPPDSAEGTRRGSGRTRLGNFARTRSVGFSHFSFSSKKVYTVEGLFQSCVSKLSVSAPLALREQMLLYRLLQRLSARNKSSMRGLVQPGESNGNRNSYPALLRNSRSFPIQPLIPPSYFDRPPTPTPPPPPPPGSPYPDSPLPTSPNPLDINPLAKSPSLRKRLAGKIAKPRRRSSVKKSNPLSSTSEDQMRKNSTKRKKKKKAEGKGEEEKEEKGQAPTERKDSAFPEDPKTIPEIDEPDPKSDEIIPKSPKTDRRRFSFQKLSTTINPFLSTIYPLPNSSDTPFEKDTNEPPSFSPNTIQPGKNSILTFQAPPKTWVASTIFQRQAHETCDWIENPVFDVVENPDVNPDAPDSSVETLSSSSSSSSSSSLTGSQPSLLKLQPLAQHAEIVRYALAEGATETH